MRERPGLAAHIAHLPDLDAGLLHDLAPHRMLDIVARLHIARERRIELVGEAVLAARAGSGPRA